MQGTYLKLALNNAWANATLYAAAGALTDAAFTARRVGFFPSLSATLNHILAVDLYYLDALEGGGRGLSIFATPPPADCQALAAKQAEADMRLAGFCNKISHKALAGRIGIERSGGVMQEPVGDTLLHLFQHQIHHRGQAHVQLQQAGAAPPQLDEFFLAHDRAPTAQAYWS